ncbi:hypothetical protein C8J57DRAFT_1464524, partial [Mycena rebaudengoi]
MKNNERLVVTKAAFSDSRVSRVNMMGDGERRRREASEASRLVVTARRTVERGTEGSATLQQRPGAGAAVGGDDGCTEYAQISPGPKESNSKVLVHTKIPLNFLASFHVFTPHPRYFPKFPLAIHSTHVFTHTTPAHSIPSPYLQAAILLLLQIDHTRADESSSASASHLVDQYDPSSRFGTRFTEEILSATAILGRPKSTPTRALILQPRCNWKVFWLGVAPTALPTRRASRNSSIANEPPTTLDFVSKDQHSPKGSVHFILLYLPVNSACTCCEHRTSVNEAGYLTNQLTLTPPPTAPNAPQLRRYALYLFSGTLPLFLITTYTTCHVEWERSWYYIYMPLRRRET